MLNKLKSVEGGVDMKGARHFCQKLGAPLGMDAENAAAAVLQMANTKMAGATRMVSVSLGADPRDFSLFAFGGAGPLHASAGQRTGLFPSFGACPTRYYQCAGLCGGRFAP